MAIEAGQINPNNHTSSFHGVDHNYYASGVPANLDSLLLCQPAAAATEAVFQSPLCMPTMAPDGTRVSRNEHGKRCREYYGCSSSVLGCEAAVQIQGQQRELDCLLSLHTQRLRMELEERTLRSYKVLVSGVRGAVTAAIREKDEAISRLTKLNWDLHERIRSISMENDLWRGLAQSNEAAANSLRTDLERVLMSPGLVEDHKVSPEGNEDDAESCRGSSDGASADYDDDTASTMGRRGCKGSCQGRNEAMVLVMPCRHLCLCTTCGSGSRQSCPVCGCAITASVHVNFS
ncbi:hypothetical protein MLD38_019192 [Melastoma candidum]|uniref:Uncharacterized protein n=1 Tax=Melastoma candidum TaxID=119954 RepID=A0ACB9QZA9_9MYRT|nr:hypothetical protein MLD38_019192 [Melastoma candidum]